MSLIPGLPGQKTDLFDGAKIDAISEYTTGNGVQLQGRTSGVAIEAGKVGEVKYSIQAGTFNPVSGQWNDIVSAGLPLTSGIWSLSAWSYTERGSATITDQLAAFALLTVSGNLATGISYGKNAISSYWPTTTSPSISANLTMVIRCDGANIYLEDGTTLSGTTIYFKHYYAGFTGSLSAKGKVTAVRIA